MDIEKKYDLIEKYLDGVLTEDERKSFEQQLKSDTLLQSELDLHKQVAETLKGDKIHDFRKVLDEVDQKWQAPNKTAKKKIFSLNFSRIAAIAATVLLLVLAYQFLVPKNNTSNTALFANNFEPYQMVLNQRSITIDGGDEVLLSNAIAAYETKDFKKSAKNFEQLQAQQPTVILFSFYKALAYLSAGSTEKAISTFEKIIQQKDHLFLEQSRWYFAMAYLQKDDADNAIKQLQQIEKGKYKYEAAQALLKDLN